MSLMDRVVALFGRSVRRQTSSVEEVPSNGDSKSSSTIPTSSSTRPSETSVPVSKTPTSSATSASVAPSTTEISTSSTSSITPPSTITTTTRVSQPSVILVQTTSTADGSANTVTAVSPSAGTQTYIVVENTTVSQSVVPTSSGLPDRTGASSQSNSFLNNKVASGIVFGLCGLVGLLLILLLVWLTMRKRLRIKKLEKEIISFDPEDVGHFHHHHKDLETSSINSLEKGRSVSSLDQYAGGGYAPTMNAANVDYRNATPTPFSEYRPQHVGIQHPGNAAFNPMSNSALTYSQSVIKKPQTFNR